MSDVELKPCPFCGGKAEFDRIGDRRQSTIIICADCGARLETGEERNHGSAWNTRAPDAELLSLRAQNERMREALKPFAIEARIYDPVENDDDQLGFCSSFTCGHLRAARAVLGE